MPFKFLITQLLPACPNSTLARVAPNSQAYAYFIHRFYLFSPPHTYTDTENQINLQNLVIGKFESEYSWQRMMSRFWVDGLAHM